VDQESSREKIQVRQEQFPVIKFGADEKAAAIIQHVEHGKVQRQFAETTDEVRHPIARVRRSESVATGARARADVAVALDERNHSGWPNGEPGHGRA